MIPTRSQVSFPTAAARGLGPPLAAADGMSETSCTLPVSSSPRSDAALAPCLRRSHLFRFSSLVMMSSATLLAILPLTAQDSPEQPDPGAKLDSATGELLRDQNLSDKEAFATLLKELAGDDRQRGLRAAHQLLERVQRGGSPGTQVRHRNFLRELLDPAALRTGKVPWECTASVVHELRTWIPRQGVPYSTFAADLLPMVGVGPETLRTLVADTCVETIKVERAEGASQTLSDLAARIVADPPPTEIALRDSVTIIWATDPRRAVELLVNALTYYAENRTLPVPPHHTGETLMWASISELRRRVRVDFPTPKAWEEWWATAEDKSLETVLYEHGATSRKRFMSAWARMIDHLKETQHAERVLSALRDSLGFIYEAESRLEVVSALGEFGRWLEAAPLPESSPPGTKVALQRQAIELLLLVIERESYPLESSMVIRSALAGLAQYRDYIDQSTEASRRLTDKIVLLMTSLADSRREADQAIFLEAVRVAGALRIEAVQHLVESILLSTPDGDAPDLALMTSAVTTLGRIVEDRGMENATAERIVELFNENDSNQPAARDFRRACIGALEAAAKQSEQHELLLRFYGSLLAKRQEQALRVRVILGLGSLVRADNQAALNTLLEIVQHSEQYKEKEILAVLDVVASSVAGDEAIRQFLGFLGAHGPAVEEALHRKILSVLDSDAVSLFPVLSGELLRLAVESGGVGVLRSALPLLRAPQLAEFLEPRKLDLSDQATLMKGWNVALEVWRIRDILALDEEVLGTTQTLRELIEKHAEIGTQHPAGVAEFERGESAFALRKTIQQRLRSLEGAEAQQTISELRGLLAVEESVVGRFAQLLWWERELTALEDRERQQTLRDATIAVLTEEASSKLWHGVADGFRVRFLARVRQIGSEELPRPESPDESEGGQEDANDG